MDPKIMEMFMKMMQQGNQSPSFGQNLMQMLPGFGMNAVGGIFEALFSGKGKEKKAAGKELAGDRDRMLGAMGKDVIDPMQAASFTEKASRPRMQREADLLSETSDIFSPHVFGALKARQGGSIDQIFANAFSENAFMKSARDTELMRSLLGQSSQRYSQAWA